MLTNPNSPLITKYEYDALPPFPLELMPQAIVDIVNDLKENAGYNIDFTAASILYAAAVAMGGTYKAEVFEGFTQQPILYLCLVAGAGIGKSHPLTWAIKSLIQRDALSYKHYKEKMVLWMENEALSKDKRDKNITKPVFKKFILSDYTPEALVVKHADNLRGMGIYIDEIAGWFGNFNRYNSGSEEQFWLSSFNGSLISIDRKGSEPLMIESPNISVAGTIQPNVLNKIASDGKANNGFLDRILFVAPDVKKEAWKEKGISIATSEKWEAIISNLMQLDFVRDNEGNEQATVIKFNTEANAILREWQKRNTDKCNEDEGFASIGAKGETYVVRLSLIVRALRFASESELKDRSPEIKAAKMDAISTKDVRSAIALTDYFTDTAMRIRKATMGDPLAMLPTKTKAFYNILPDSFATADGVDIALKAAIPERTAKRFFSDKKVFIRVEHGYYQKKII